jgi:hypothetical protein
MSFNAVTDSRDLRHGRGCMLKYPRTRGARYSTASFEPYRCDRTWNGRNGLELISGQPRRWCVLVLSRLLRKNQTEPRRIMFARVATFEGDHAQITQMAEAIGRDSESGPPEGVPAKEVLILTGRDSGKLIAILLFESEDDLRQGDATLNQMSPPADAATVARSDVEMFEVAVRAGA